MRANQRELQVIHMKKLEEGFYVYNYNELS